MTRPAGNIRPGDPRLDPSITLIEAQFPKQRKNQSTEHSSPLFLQCAIICTIFIAIRNGIHNIWMGPFSVFCFSSRNPKGKRFYLYLSLVFCFAKLFMTIVYMIIAFAIPHMPGVPLSGRLLCGCLVHFQQHLFAGLALQYSRPSWLQIISPKWPCFPFCSSRMGKKGRQIWTHPSLANQPVYIRSHVAHSRHPFLFRFL